MSLREGCDTQFIKNTQKGVPRIFRVSCFYFDLKSPRPVGIGHLIALKKVAVILPIASAYVQVANGHQFNLPIMLQDGACGGMGLPVRP